LAGKRKCNAIAIVLSVLVFSSAYAQDATDAVPSTMIPAGNTASTLEKEIIVLVKELGSENWRAREDAMQRLIEIGKPAIRAMAAAWHTDDMEVRERTERFLDKYHWVSPEDASRIEDLISLYIKGAQSKKKTPQIEIDKWLEQLKSEDLTVSQEASRKLIEAGEQALEAVVKLSRAGDDTANSTADKIKIAILTDMQAFESEVLDGIERIRHSVFYLLEKLKPGTEEPARQAKVAEILSGIAGLKKPDISVSTGKVTINGLEFMRPPGGLVVSQKGNGTVTINNVAVPVPGRMIEGIKPGELLTKIVQKKEVSSEIKANTVEMIGSVKIKNALPAIMQAAEKLKLDKEEDRNLLTTILRILPMITEGGPSCPLAGKDGKELKNALQAWQQWWHGNKANPTRAERKKKLPAWRRRNK